MTGRAATTSLAAPPPGSESSWPEGCQRWNGGGALEPGARQRQGLEAFPELGVVDLDQGQRAFLVDQHQPGGGARLAA